MFYIIENTGLNTINDFIFTEMNTTNIQDCGNYFLVAIVKSSIKGKFIVSVRYYDKRSDNIIQFTSIPLSTREKAENFAKGITANRKYVKPLNF